MPTQGFFIRDIPVPMKNGLHPCRPPSGSAVAFASARRRTATATPTLLQGRSDASRDRDDDRLATIVDRDRLPSLNRGAIAVAIAVKAWRNDELAMQP